MASITQEALVNAKLEDGELLNAIVGMAQDRASAARSTFDYSQADFNYNVVTLSKLQKLRDWVLDMAAAFVNMDYPYWDFQWAKFPQKYSADYINRDADHNLNILPANCASFDDISVETYRTFLKDLVYWLQKFRYTVADRSYYDKTFQRRWEWQQSAVPLSTDYQWRYSENDVDGACDQGKLEELQSSQVGIVDTDQPSRYSSAFNVDMHYDGNFAKLMGHGRNTPLQELLEEDYVYELRGIPHNLVTDNPTGLRADLYWYIVPRGYKREGAVYEEKWVDEVVAKDEGTTYTWGDEDQYSGTNYTATAGQTTGTTTYGRRGSMRGWFYEFQTETTIRRKETNWSDDGTRYYVVSDTTEPWSRGAAVNWVRDSLYKYPTFGLVPPLSEAPPRFLAGRIEPHDKFTYHVCDQDNLPAPSYAPPTPVYSGESFFCWGITCTSDRTFASLTKWIPILDFGDYALPPPEEESQGGG